MFLSKLTPVPFIKLILSLILVLFSPADQQPFMLEKDGVQKIRVPYCYVICGEIKDPRKFIFNVFYCTFYLLDIFFGQSVNVKSREICPFCLVSS